VHEVQMSRTKLPIIEIIKPESGLSDSQLAPAPKKSADKKTSSGLCSGVPNYGKLEVEGDRRAPARRVIPPQSANGMDSTNPTFEIDTPQNGLPDDALDALAVLLIGVADADDAPAPPRNAEGQRPRQRKAGPAKFTDDGHNPTISSTR
jgi:hypothetical protein